MNRLIIGNPDEKSEEEHNYFIFEYLYYRTDKSKYHYSKLDI